MVLTDTHTHLYYETDPEALLALMQRSLDNEVTRLFLPNVDTTSIPLVMNLAALYPQNCFPMLGLHPCDVKETYKEELASIYAAIPAQKIYAIGEIGIDLYWDKTFLKEQEEAFILKHRDEKLRGIFHCFTGTLEQAQQIIELRFCLGIGGVVTYKNSGLDAVVAQISLEHLVLETDSPYLPPVPFRGKPNESSYLLHIAQKVADLHQIPIEELARITTENSTKIFGI